MEFAINQPVYIVNLKKKGVVKEADATNNKSKVTFYNKEDKRITAWMDNSELQHYAIKKARDIIKQIEKRGEHKDRVAKLHGGEIVLTGKQVNELFKATGAVKEVLSAPIGDVIEGQKKFMEEFREYLSKLRLKIQVKYFADIEPLEKISKGNWIDLRAATDIELKAGEYKLIPLGVGMKLPAGYEANFAPRSSTFKNFGIIQTNHYSVIDDTFSGNDDQWHFPAYAVRDTVIKKNDRICQFRINEIMPEVELETVDNLDDVNRGGFGTTGKQ